MKTLRVLTTGTFDIPHAGHARFLRLAETLGDLKVGVLSDRFVEAYKGSAPLYNEKERRSLVEGMGHHAQIIEDQRRWFLTNGEGGNTIIAVGSDWATKDFHKQINIYPHEMWNMGWTIRYVPYTKGISTSDIRDRIRNEA